MSQKLLVGIVVAVVSAVGASGATASPVPLLLPQSTAFSYLGHSCGGIQEHAYATGFDPASGYPAGDVYMQTRCGGSGRGGGYHTTTYSAWAAVTWDFNSGVLSSATLTTTPSVSVTFSATDANGDVIYNTATAAYLTVVAPGAPTSISAVQVGDAFQVSWTPTTPNPKVITSSTITATPVGSLAPVLVSTVAGYPVAGLTAPLQPGTQYQITVVSTDAGGTSSPSVPISVTTHTASLVPAAPTGVGARWTSPGSPLDTLVASWKAATGGDSPVDQYQVTITGSDGGGTFTQSVSATTFVATFAVSDIPDRSIKVRAHNAAGWSAWSARFTLGGA